MNAHLFVYGTLRSDCAHLESAAPAAPYRELIADAGERLGVATAAGRLLAVAWFPGLVAGKGRVVGELWRLRDPAPVIAALDYFEGPEFRLSVALAALEDGHAVRAAVWRFVGDRTGLEVIASGDYRIWGETRYPLEA